MTERGDGGILLIDITEIDTALSQFTDDDIADPLELVAILRREGDELRLGQGDLGAASLEVEAGH